MRLIDADALADALFEKRKNYPQWVADVIGNMPDAIVMCKNCKWKYEDDGRSLCGYHSGWFPAEPNWFCADGERR